MKKYIILALLMAVIMVSGCVQGETEAVAGGTTGPAATTGGSAATVSITDEASAIAVANQTENALLFLNMYPEANISIESKTCCAEAINESSSCQNCEATQDMWVATIAFGQKKVVIALDGTENIVASYPAIEYIRSGKHCKEDSDCVNIGSSTAAMCLNEFYATKEGVVCNENLVTCTKDVQCCKCILNECLKKITTKPESECVESASGSSSSGGSSGTMRCSDISELNEGQEVAAGIRTLKFKGVYKDAGNVYSAKFIVTDEDQGTSTKYIKEGGTDYVGGVEIHVTSIVVPVSSGGATAALTLTGMGITCTID